MQNAHADAQMILRRVGAFLTGHFVYTSGRHGENYVNKDALYPHTKETSSLCRMLAESMIEAEIEVVAGPALGGIILSQWTAHHLDVLGVYLDKTPEGLALQRGYDKLVVGKRIGVVEDVLTTGKSLAQAVDAIQACGGDVQATAALVNRGGITAADVHAPQLFSLVSLNMPSYPPDACPLCDTGIPLNTEVGKGGLATAGPHPPTPASLP